MYPEASVGVAMWEASGSIVAWRMVRNVAVANHVTMLVFSFCVICKAFHDDPTVVWCSLCEERVALWWSACEGEDAVSQRLCRRCRFEQGRTRNVVCL